MVLERADPAPVGHADDHLAVEASLRAHAVAGGVVLDLMEALEAEAGELDLADGLEAVERHADRGADDGRFGQRAVDDALAPELAVQVLGDSEDAAVHADVLADDDDVLVALHLLEQRQVEGLDHVQFRHRLVLRWPRIGGEGCGSPSGGALSLRSRSRISSRWATRWGGGSAYTWSNIRRGSAAAPPPHRGAAAAGSAATPRPPPPPGRGFFF